MDSRTRLFLTTQLYNLPATDALFLDAMREGLRYHTRRCPEYARILASRDFDPACLRDIGDLHRLPPLPTLFLKTHALFSIPYRKLPIKATSSGTRGIPSRMGMDTRGSLLALAMVWRTFRHHRLLSLRPTNYIVLGYQPSKRNTLGVAQTAFGATLLAPALHREYALRDTGDAYALNLDGVIAALIRYQRQGQPVRLLGFPAYLHFLLTALKEDGVRLKLHPRSRILLGGGWKQFMLQETDKGELYAMAEEWLGIGEQRCHDCFGAVEHPIVYADCPRHHFHVPAYSRVIVRDPATLEPLPYGQPGILNLITPLLHSMPLLSILTDDVAVLHAPASCGCGIVSPWFEVLGRAGLDIKTCAAGAADLLKEVAL